MWSSKPDILRNVLLIERERLLEHARKLPDLPLESLLIGPRHTGVQQFPRDALNRGGYRQPKRPEALVVRLGKLAGVDGVDDGTRVFERAPLACAEFPACPARVDEPAVDFVF